MSAPSSIERFDRAFFRPAGRLACGGRGDCSALVDQRDRNYDCGLACFLPTLDAASIKRELITAAGGLPVVL
jgi:hypothetical protein